MASSTIPTHYPQLVDPTRTPLAFLNRAVPRLVRFRFEKKNNNTKSLFFLALLEFGIEQQRIASTTTSRSVALWLSPWSGSRHTLSWRRFDSSFLISIIHSEFFFYVQGFHRLCLNYSKIKINFVDWKPLNVIMSLLVNPFEPDSKNDGFITLSDRVLWMNAVVLT